MISFTSMRKERILRCWGIILPVALLIYIMLCRFLPGCARGYADYVYPNVSFVLSAVSSVIPVSWEEIMAVVVVSLMIFIPVMARRRGEGWLVVVLLCNLNFNLYHTIRQPHPGKRYHF